MQTIPAEALGAFLSKRKDVVFAVLFGSARDGGVRDGGDVDIGIYFDPKPNTEEFVDFLVRTADLLEVDEIDCTDLRSADPILAFEAVSGRMLCKNDPARTAAIVSLISREYEDALWHLQHPA
jgi:predicted nucleotidyltransferase